jgi:DNA invertase Pin-like site-specific DNA recombinase
LGLDGTAFYFGCGLASADSLEQVQHLLRALETSRTQAASLFLSFSEQIDTSAPAGKIVFTLLGAVAELERGLTPHRHGRTVRRWTNRTPRGITAQLAAELLSACYRLTERTVSA